MYLVNSKRTGRWLRPRVPRKFDSFVNVDKKCLVLTGKKKITCKFKSVVMYLVWKRFEKKEVIIKCLTIIVLLLSPVTILIVSIHLIFNPLFFSPLYIISLIPWNDRRAELVSSSQITHFLFTTFEGNCSRNKTIHSRVSVVRLQTAYCIGFITAVSLPLFGLMIVSA